MDTQSDDFVLVEHETHPDYDGTLSCIAPNELTTKDKIENVFFNVKNTLKDNTLKAVDHVKGRVAPNSVYRTGFLEKQETDYCWQQYYFIFKDGFIHALLSPEDQKAQVSLPVSSIKNVENVDSLMTGRQNSFKVTLFVTNSDDVEVTSYSFFGVQFATRSSITGKNISLFFCTDSEMDREGWVRDLNAASDGVAIKEHAKTVGKTAFMLAKTVGIATFVRTATVMTATRAGHRTANAIIKEPHHYENYR
jgi:hypothetical protein